MKNKVLCWFSVPSKTMWFGFFSLFWSVGGPVIWPFRLEVKRFRSSLYKHTAAVWVFCECVTCDIVAERSKQRCENLWARNVDSERQNVWKDWKNKMPAVIKWAKLDWVRASVPLSYNCLCFCMKYVRVCVQLSDNSTLSLPPLSADYWSYMSCGGAPGKLHTSVPALFRS